MMGKGLRDTNPIEQYNERPLIKINDDFVMPQPMETLRDLSTVDFNDFLDVRDRVLTFALSYDFCLRDGETALIEVADIAFDGNFVALTLRSEVQKGQNKPQVTLYSCFDESRRLVTAYLDLRKKYLGERCEDSFMISDKRRRMGGSGVCSAVKSHCDKLGVTTRKGDCPTPHEFRHTFGTINIDKLGLCLSPYYIQGRLRHSDLETTIKTYVQNNPLLAKQNHIANVQGARERIGSPALNTPESIASPTGYSQPNDKTMPEAEAISIVRPLGIVAQSLRHYAETKGITEKKNSQVLYSRSFILDLSKNWLTKQQVMKRLNFGVSRWHMWKKTRGIEPVVIGKRSFVRASDVFNELKK